MKNFKYFRATSLGEVISLLAENRQSKILAGGTDLLVEMQRGEITPRAVIDIKKIPGLNKIEINGNGSLSIGPLVTFSDILDHSILREKYSILYQSAQVMGTTQIRNRATIGGNICSGSPYGDSVLPLICLGAQLRFINQEGDRWVPIETFYEGSPKTPLHSDEVLSEIRVPPLRPKTFGAYLKRGVKICILVSFNKNGGCIEDSRILLGPIASTPIRCKQAEEVLRGKEINENRIENVAVTVQEEIKPFFESGAISEYRYEMVYVLTKRVLKNCLIN